MNTEKSIYEKIQDKYYEPKGPYPSAREIMKKSGYLKQKEDIQNSFVGTLPEINEKIKELDEQIQKEYKKAMDNWNQEESDLENEFKSDLEKEFGVTDNPKRELLYEKAYSRGHSEGMYEVYSVYQDLVELILP